MKGILLSLTILLLLPSLVSATDYYVTQSGGGGNGGDGSSGDPWSVSQFNALTGTSYAGDTFYFSGTFSGSDAELNVGISGTSGNYVTLDGYQAGDYNAVTNYPTNGVAVLDRGERNDIIDPDDNMQYLIIQDFKLRYGRMGVMLEENYYIIVRRCRFEESVEGGDYQAETAIKGYNSDHLTIGGVLGNTEDGNYVYHWGCREDSYRKCTGDYATRFTRCDHVEFRYNYILDSQNGFGWEYSTQYWLAEYNYIEETNDEGLAIVREGGMTGKEGLDGIIRFNKVVGKDGGIQVGSNAERLYVYGNYVQDAYQDNTRASPGVCSGGSSNWACDGIDTGPFYFWANIIDNGNQFGLMTGRISSGTTDTVEAHFWNNVIYNIDTYDSEYPDSLYESSRWTGFTFLGPAVDSSFKNNILLDNYEPGYSDTAQAYIEDGYESDIDIDYNLYYITGQASDPGSIKYQDLTQVVSSVESNGRYGNPDFVNHANGNFVLDSGSLALTSGDSAVGGLLDTITITAGDGIARQYTVNSAELLNPAATDWSTFPPTVNVINKIDTAYPSVQGAYAYIGDSQDTCESLGGFCCISPQTCPGADLGTFADCSGTCCSESCQTPGQDTCLDRGFYCCLACVPDTEHPENDTDCPVVCCGECLEEPAQDYNYSIIKTLFPLLIDGELSEDAWSHAHMIAFSNPSRSDNLVEVRILWDTDSLYFAYNVADQNLEAVNQSLWNDDGAELYLDTGNDKSTGMDSNDYHFTVNIYDLTQEPGIQSVTTHDPNSYTMEMSIPWSAISSQPSFGMVMGLLLANNDRDGGESSQFDWLNLIETGSYSRPNLWGDVLFTVRADSSRDGCVHMDELVPFIDLWKYDSTAYPMREMMEAVTLYYSPGAWC